MLYVEPSGVAGVTEEVMAPILEAPSAAADVEILILILEAVSTEKEKEAESSRFYIESHGDGICSGTSSFRFETMVTNQEQSL